MGLTRRTALYLAIITLCLTSICSAAVVTVDATSKSAKSDDTALEPLGVKVSGGQVGLVVNSTIVEPQFFTLRFSGLTEPTYDIWINGQRSYSKTAEELEKGIELGIDGRITDPTMMKCLNAVKPRVDAGEKQFEKLTDLEAKRVYGTLSQAAGWTTASLRFEQAWRSVRIIVQPVGRALQGMGWGTRKNDIETAGAVTRACWLLQQARDRMFDAIKNPEYRNNAVMAMTPVDFAATYMMKGGKPHVEADLVNSCDLPLNGTISLSLPKGWKTNAKSFKVQSLKPGKTLRLSFDLIAPSKTATAPDSVPIAANLTLARDEFVAGIKLKQVAAMQ